MKLLLVGVCATVALALAGAAAADQSYTDSSGEVAGSADITSAVVSNDPTAGSLTFVVNTTMPTMEAGAEVDILADADRNSATGAPGGLDYLFGLDSGGWYFAKWDGSQFSDVAAVNDATVSYVNGVFTFRLAAADLGSPTAFNFVVVTFRGSDPNNPLVDEAPDAGLWSYTMVTPPPPPPPPPPAAVTIDSVSIATAPATATHGKTFRVTGLTVDLSNGVETKATGLKCSATLGGTHLAGKGTGGCTYALPKDAKGKKLTVKATGKYKTKTVAKSVSLKVK